MRMRRLYIALIFTTNLLLAAHSPNRCEETTRTIRDLQNRIVARSFTGLKTGDWARYSDGSVLLCVGRTSSPRGTLYGVELQSPKIPDIQVWYAAVDKNVPTPFGTMRFRTIEPRKVYFRSGGGVIVLEGDGLRSIFRQYTGTDRFLTAADIRKTLDCSRRTVLTPLPRYPIGRGKTVEAFKITQRKKGRALVVSPRVPFGFVEVPGKSPTLAAFGHGGIRPHIGKSARQNAFSINFLQALR